MVSCHGFNLHFSKCLLLLKFHPCVVIFLISSKKNGHWVTWKSYLCYWKIIEMVYFLDYNWELDHLDECCQIFPIQWFFSCLVKFCSKVKNCMKLLIFGYLTCRQLEELSLCFAIIDSDPNFYKLSFVYRESST